jgi:predicted dinucleotide-binding enzyme
MRFGIIGAGNIGQAVARHAVAAGHDVIISSRRGGESLAAAAAEVGATPGSVAEAAEAEIVLLAVPWSAVPAALDGLTWNGQVLIDATNAFISFSPMEIEEFGDGSSSERVASLAPGAHVVKAFNTLYARMIAADPVHAEGRQLVFYAGDDAAAKARFAEVVEGFGFATRDVGTLHDGGRLIAVGGGPLAGFHALKQDV